MMKSVKKFTGDKRGASLAEFALIFPFFALIFFGVLETGYLMWQMQQGAIAAKKAVRVAATRQIIAPGSFPDCGPGTTAAPIGTLCADLGVELGVWGSCDGGGNCTTGVTAGLDIARVTEEIRKFYPSAANDNQILYEFSGSELGFVGLGRPVPIVTVSFVNVQFDFIVLSGFGIGPITMPAMSSSAPAEDLTNGSGA